MRLTLSMVVLFCGYFAVPIQAEPRVPDGDRGARAESRIHITADKLESIHQMGWVEFVGNVRATQSDIVMTADRMRVFYEADADSKLDKGKISKIISEGNVVIVFDNQTKKATAHRAVYLAGQQVLELSGGDAKLSSGESTVQGKKIKLFYAEGRSVVEGAGQEQVEATLFVEEGDGLMK
jgi:lipopolysaccharide transport protein LptA